MKTGKSLTSFLLLFGAAALCACAALTSSPRPPDCSGQSAADRVKLHNNLINCYENLRSP